jgi:acetyl-CoA carboxylase biotin carboxyl carrier protein
MSGTHEDFANLLSAFERSDWQEMTVEIGGDHLHVSRRGGSADRLAITKGRAPKQAVDADASVPDPSTDSAVSAPEPGVTGAEVVDTNPSAPDGVAVVSPSVGIFWRAPSPTSAPFVEVGSLVDAEDTVGIVEVMKLMQQVLAGVSGVVSSIEIENGGTVEHGEPLVYVRTVGES